MSIRQRKHMAFAMRQFFWQMAFLEGRLPRRPLSVGVEPDPPPMWKIISDVFTVFSKRNR